MALTGLLGGVIVFFWAILSQQAYLWEDVPEQWYPLTSYTASELRAGRFPLWNPYLFGGVPFFAMIDVAVLYPLNWIFVFFVDNMMVSYTVVEYHIIAHVFLIGAAVYLFCRNLSLSYGGSFIAGLIFMLCGVTVHNVLHPGFIFALTWFPVVFMVFMRALERLSYPLGIMAGGLLGILILAGHAQVFVYVSYTLGLYTLFCLIERYRSVGFHASLLHVSSIAAVVMVTGFGMAAVALLPMIELIPHALRPDVTYEVATSYARHPQELITLLMPDFYGRMEPSQWNYWGPGSGEYGHFWETHSYFGILPLMLTCVALTLKRTRLILFLAILAVLTLLLSMGEATPLHRFAYDLVPGFDRFRGAARFSILYGFAVAVLSGFAVDSLRQMKPTDQLRLNMCLKIIGGVFVVAILIYVAAGDIVSGWLAGSTEFQDLARQSIAIHTRSLVILLFLSGGLIIAWSRVRKAHGVMLFAAAILIFFDLYFAGYEFNANLKSPDAYYPRSNLINFLEERQALEGGRARTRQTRSLLMTRNAGVLYRIQTMEGYLSPLRLSITTPPLYSDELMNVKYRIKVDDKTDSAVLVSNPITMPSAYVVRNFVVAEGRENVAEAMQDSTFDFRTTVTLDAKPSLDIQPESFPASEKPNFTNYEPNSMTIMVDMESPGLLVLGEVYYPAWQAYVDGKTERIYRANDTMRAIPLSAGTHTVELRYESASFRMGVMISCVGLVVVVFNLGMLLRRRK